MTDAITKRTTPELDAGLDHIRSAPTDDGEVLLIVTRPTEDERVVVEEGRLDTGVGLVGDNWLTRGTPTSDRGDPGRQLTIMNSRVLDVIAGPMENWPAAGDQLYVDLDLSEDNLPAGTTLAIGGGVVEVSELPHLGCGKFVRRFGLDAHRWVNSEAGLTLKLRGINARVLESGPIHIGDRVKKV